MVVTPEVIGVVIAAFGGAATLLAGVAGLNTRLERRLDRRFERIDGDLAGVKAELSGVRAELVDVKIAIARIEGPQTRLLRP